VLTEREVFNLTVNSKWAGSRANRREIQGQKGRERGRKVAPPSLNPGAGGERKPIEEKRGTGPQGVLSRLLCRSDLTKRKGPPEKRGQGSRVPAKPYQRALSAGAD